MDKTHEFCAQFVQVMSLHQSQQGKSTYHRHDQVVLLLVKLCVG